MSGYRLTRRAALDVAGILGATLRTFGTFQHDAYAGLIKSAAAMVAEHPDRPGSRERGDLLPRARSFHIELAAGRMGAAAHILYYVVEGGEVIIVRVLHQSMDPSLDRLAGLL